MSPLRPTRWDADSWQSKQTAPAAPATTWRCPKCGPVNPADVYRVPSPVDTVHNHRVRDPLGNITGTRHTVTRNATGGAS